MAYYTTSLQGGVTLETGTPNNFSRLFWIIHWSFPGYVSRHLGDWKASKKFYCLCSADDCRLDTYSTIQEKKQNRIQCRLSPFYNCLSTFAQFLHETNAVWWWFLHVTSFPESSHPCIPRRAAIAAIVDAWDAKEDETQGQGFMLA